jgi:hypothetical protein
LSTGYDRLRWQDGLHCRRRVKDRVFPASHSPRKDRRDDGNMGGTAGIPPTGRPPPSFGPVGLGRTILPKRAGRRRPDAIPRHPRSLKSSTHPEPPPSAPSKNPNRLYFGTFGLYFCRGGYYIGSLLRSMRAERLWQTRSRYVATCGHHSDSGV